MSDLLPPVEAYRWWCSTNAGVVIVVAETGHDAELLVAGATGVKPWRCRRATVADQERVDAIRAGEARLDAEMQAGRRGR